MICGGEMFAVKKEEIGDLALIKLPTVRQAGQHVHIRQSLALAHSLVPLNGDSAKVHASVNNLLFKVARTSLFVKVEGKCRNNTVTTEDWGRPACLEAEW